MENTSAASILQAIPLDTVLWVVFGVVLILFGTFSAVLLWHWKLYSTGKFTTVSNMILYLSVSTVFLVTMIASILWLSLI